jgi:hypothetical protein
MIFRKERKLIDTVSFRTQAFFRQVTKKIAEFLFKTRYSVLSRAIFEVGSLDLIANLAKLTSLERKILVEKNIFGIPSSPIIRQVLNISNTIHLVSTKIFQLKDNRILKNKQAISDLWKIIYNNIEEILNFILARFSEELILVFKSDDESLFISNKVREKITNNLPFKEEAEIGILNEILWNGNINSRKVFKKIVDFSSIESLKLWLWLEVALLIKLVILIEYRRRYPDIKAFKILLYNIQDSLEKWIKSYQLISTN